MTQTPGPDSVAAHVPPDTAGDQPHGLLAPLLPGGEPIESLLRKAQFFQPGEPTKDHRELHRIGGRGAEEFHRERWPPGQCSTTWVPPTSLPRTGCPWVPPAITVVAGARIVQMADAPMVTATRGLIAGASVVFWVFGTWLIPPLVAAGVWRHVVHRIPLRYEAPLWSVIFPLGMYGVGGHYTRRGGPPAHRQGHRRQRELGRARSVDGDLPCNAGAREPVAHPAAVSFLQAVSYK